MPPNRLFFDPKTGDVDTDWILEEAVPIAKLVLVFGAIAALSFLLASIFSGSGISLLFAVAGQFVVAVGTGVVLLYVIVRARQLGDELENRAGNDRV
ncbi:hypothetical protein ACFOZ7_06475 [Natribaculum luteum]|uniref:DUF485 domain-containing protein n=1 Tax=Natribaculum luteum TaxID=1586232 RepID=A0ABD5NX50_9EURY|nr:hypothetical protein [Natribaculum luteum]